MSDEQIEQAIEAIQTMLAARACEAAKVIEGTGRSLPRFRLPTGSHLRLRRRPR